MSIYLFDQLYLGMIRPRRAGAATFADLFPDGTTGGVWPAFGGGVFTDAQQPAVAGESDPVGFALDPSKGVAFSSGNFTGVGGNVLTNGDFATGDLTGWTLTGIAIGEVIDGAAYVTGPNLSGVGQTASTEANGFQVLTFLDLGANIAGSPDGRWQLLMTSSEGQNYLSSFLGSTSSSRTFIHRSNGGDMEINFRSRTTNLTFGIDDLELRIAPGFHSIQETTADKMVLSATVGGILYFDNQEIATKTLQAVLPAGDYYPLAVTPDGTITTGTMISHAGGPLDVVTGQVNMAAMRDTAWGAADLAIVERLYQQQGG